MKDDLAWRCPSVTPALFVPGADPPTYLSIFVVGTDKTANKWNVAVFDSGADVTLCSEAFAEANGLNFGGAQLPIHTADGGSTSTLGSLVSTLEFVLAADTPYACSAVAPVQVVAGVSHLYDLIISMEVIAQWSAHVDMKDHQLVFRPQHWLGGDSELQATLPMLLRSRPSPGSDLTTRLQRPTPPEEWSTAISRVSRLCEV